MINNPPSLDEAARDNRANQFNLRNSEPCLNVDASATGTKCALLVSFDLIHHDEPPVSLSVASLLASARQAEARGILLHIEHRAFNLLGPPLTPEQVVTALQADYPLSSFDAIALSAYVWSEYLVGDVLRLLRDTGFTGLLVLGGCQISYGQKRDLVVAYPDADIFVQGYAEESIVTTLLSERQAEPQVFTSVPDFSTLPSPYLTGALPVKRGQDRVRLETKRGCPFRCTFCAHRDLQQNRVYRLASEKTLAEFTMIQQLEVGKINVLDPVFNMGQEYLPLLRYLVDRSFAPTLALQCRMEHVRPPAGPEFLDLCANLNVVLEFGLQSIHEAELNAVQRKNMPKEQVERVLQELNQRHICYEVSLIYGLPSQTVHSFATTIAFLRDAGCSVIKAFPLMLLRGTELFDQREQYGLKERAMGPFQIPTVISSPSFDKDDWQEMRRLADGLTPTERV